MSDLPNPEAIKRMANTALRYCLVTQRLALRVILPNLLSSYIRANEAHQDSLPTVSLLPLPLLSPSSAVLF